MWRWVKAHGISLARYDSGKGCGLKTLCEELEAENEGVRIPSNIRWLCGKKDIQPHGLMKGITAPSVVFTVVGDLCPPLQNGSAAPNCSLPFFLVCPPPPFFLLLYSFPLRSAE